MVKWKHVRHHCPSPSLDPHRRGRECDVGLLLPTILSRGHTKNLSTLQDGMKNSDESQKSNHRYSTEKRVPACHIDSSFTLKTAQPLLFEGNNSFVLEYLRVLRKKGIKAEFSYLSQSESSQNTLPRFLDQEVLYSSYGNGSKTPQCLWDFLLHRLSGNDGRREELQTKIRPLCSYHPDK